MNGEDRERYRYRAPTALSGRVSVGADSCIVHGAVPAAGRICRVRPMPSTNQPYQFRFYIGDCHEPHPPHPPPNAVGNWVRA